MVKIVEAIEYLHPVEFGGSQACFMRCLGPDGKSHVVVVKFKENVWGLTALINELVAGIIAKEFGLPTPDPLLVYVSDEMAVRINDAVACYKNYLISSGLHFGTMMMQNAVHRPSMDLINSVHNADDFTRIIVFDTLVCNHDRNNAWNFLIVCPDCPPTSSYLYIIDHTHCFGDPYWDEHVVERVNESDMNLIPQICQVITGSDPFGPALEMLNILTPALIQGILETIPQEWSCSLSCKQALGVFLLKRATLVKNILQINQWRFPGWIS